MQKVIFENQRGQSIQLGNASPFILTKIDGTGAPKTTILTSKAPGQDGKSYHGTLLEERILPMEGAVSGVTIEDLYSKIRILCSILSPKISGILTYTNDNKSYKIPYILEDLSFKDRIENIQEFLVQLYCPNPYWLDIQECKEEIAAWIGDFEFNFEISSDGILMGHRENSVIVNILNNGDTECGMRIELTALATVVNPSLVNVNTQEYIKVKRTLTAGDRLVISTSFGDKRVELIRNGVASNVFNYIDLNSTFLQLDVGDNLFRYDAEDGANNLDVAIYYRPQYVGV